MNTSYSDDKDENELRLMQLQSECRSPISSEYLILLPRLDLDCQFTCEFTESIIANHFVVERLYEEYRGIWVLQFGNRNLWTSMITIEQKDSVLDSLNRSGKK